MTMKQKRIRFTVTQADVAEARRRLAAVPRGGYVGNCAVAVAAQRQLNEPRIIVGSMYLSAGDEYYDRVGPLYVLSEALTQAVFDFDEGGELDERIPGTYYVTVDA